MKTALITGASRGIGQAVASRLARAGYRVILTARDLRACEEAAEQLTHEGYSALAIKMDVTDESSLRLAAEEVTAQGGSLDVLINNAGILPEATQQNPAEVVDVKMFRQTFEVNVFGAVAATQAFLPLLRRSVAARIVNVSSTVGSLADQTNPNSAYYSMVLPAYQSSKAALNSVTIALSKALLDTPIKVTAICPGFVQTDLTPLNKSQAPLTAAEAAEVIYRAATLPAEARSGQFIDAQGSVPW